MAFRLGIVGLCTSHPENWVPVIRDLAQEGAIEAEVVAAWDSGETRPAGFAADFCKRFEIPRAVENLEDMPDMVDGVIVHTTNWDRHVEQARPFVEAGKAAFLDKPVIGSLRDANTVLDWIQRGKRVTGGSGLRFAREIREFLAQPVEERGRPHTAYTACCMDEFNYGVHGYALLSCALGPGIRSARYIGSSRQKLIKITWSSGAIGLLSVGESSWHSFSMSIVTDKDFTHHEVSAKEIYRSLLEATLPYLTGCAEEPPLSAKEFLEPELAALAARVSWMHHGREVFLSDLRADDEGYDGTQFAVEYRRNRLG